MTRIAVILPAAYRGGTLRAAWDVARMLKTAPGSPLDVVVATAARDTTRDERELGPLGIGVRAITWKLVDGDDAARLSSGVSQPLVRAGRHQRYALPSDGAADLGDCDAWLVISDRVPAPFLPIRPYAVVVFDCLQRVVPAIHTDSAWAGQLRGMVPFVRDAALVLVTTPVTGGDVHTFFGVPRARIRLAPMCFSPPATPASGASGAEPYLVWATNRAAHKNHAVILEGLRRYYEDNGGRLQTVIVGTETEYLKADRTHPAPAAEAYLHRIRTMLSESAALRRQVTIAGEVSDAVYSASLAGARLLLHSSLYDNGTFAAFDAAWFGVPTLSARYPAMQYLDQQFGLSLSWFDSLNPASVAAGIARLDREGPPGPLPSKARLDQQHWPHRAAEFRQALEPWLTTPA